ncbi:hypothetical protein [Nocardia sp. CS682]|uniref:hypothetical protein n=1 Tax=Nocardia sp. CS682 TaxID=1047172 RepID=UPI00107569C2|nr:hypothetical protein [Nocardia sp. CS682]QBS41103.1 hypothetical protein DMB37_14235 [Nocardia sp. CS682]
MIREIIEYDDRWLLRPLRGSCVVGIEWGSDSFELLLDSPLRIVAGYGAELSPQSLALDHPDRHVITHWPTTVVERNLSAPIVSAVLFKSGRVRLGFRNGWIMFVSYRQPDLAFAVFSGETLISDRTGLLDQTEYSVVQVDRWTGEQITAPPWPSKPDDLPINYDSDDIND